MKKKQDSFNGRVKNWFCNHGSFLLCVASLAVLIVAVLILFGQGPSKNTKLSFDVASGFYNEDINVSINASNLPNFTKIKYNLNGDDLENDSLDYERAISLAVPENGYKVYTIKASFCDAERCGAPVYATYVLGNDLSNDVDLDIVSITSSQKSLYDYETGIMVPGKTRDDIENSNKYERIDVMGNFRWRDEEWIRDAHIAMFSEGGVLKLDKNIGLQVAGGTSSALAIKSLKLVGNKKYGYDKISFDFGDGFRLYNSLRLRSGAQDQNFGNVRSSVASRLIKESGFDGGSETKRVVVFLNNEFYGIFDAQQSYSDSFLADNFDLPNSNLVAKYKESESGVLQEVGIDKLFRQNLNVAENREALENAVDMDNYLMYYALQIMWNNTDWPQNNFEMWRYENDGNESYNEYEDGRYRFLIYDTDLTWYIDGNENYYPGAIGDIFEFLMENKYRGEGSMFKNVMASDYYRNKFVGILRNLINGPFETGHVLNIVDEEAAKIDRQMRIFYSDEEYASWQGWINLLKKAVSERNSVVRADAKKYFGVTL